MSEDFASYQFGEWIVDVGLNRIRSDSDEIQLEPRTMEVLAYFVERPRQVVSFDELLDRFWRGRIVNQGTIHRRIRQVRRVLGDDARNPIYLETIRKRGYRTVAPVRKLPTLAQGKSLRSALESQTPPFPAYEGAEPYVFVCYAHSNRGAVYPELIRLRDLGTNIWYDEGISPGSEWTEELARAIAGCTHFLYFISPASVSSTNCRDEVQYAREAGKSIVAIYLEPTQLPEGLRLEIGRVQGIEKHRLDDANYQRKMAAAIAGHANVQSVLRPHQEVFTQQIKPPAIAFEPLDYPVGSKALAHLARALPEDMGDLVSVATTLIRVISGPSAEATLRVTGRLRPTSKGLRIDLQMFHNDERIWSSKAVSENTDSISDQTIEDLSAAISKHAWEWIARQYESTPDKELDAFGFAFRARALDAEEALPYARKAVELDPKAGFTHAILAETLQHFVGNPKENYTDEALKHANRAVSLAPRDCATLVTAADVIHAVGDLEVALALRKRIVELLNTRFTRASLALTLISLGRLEDAKKAIDFDDPKHFTEWFVVCAINLLEGHPDRALHAMSQNIADMPDNLILLVWQMGLLGRLGRLREASRILERITEIAPDWILFEWMHAFRVAWRHDGLMDALDEGLQAVVSRFDPDRLTFS